MRTRAAWRSLALAAVWSAWLAAPAGAAEIVEVRIGNHPTFTRVVFELDAPAGYRIERRTAEGEDTEEILVTVEAGSTPRSVNSSSVMVERVAVQDGRERVAAHIRLKQSPSRVKEMILAQPPRLVFDLVFPEAELAKIRAAEERRARAAAPVERAEPPKPPEATPAEAETPPQPEAAPAPEPRAQARVAPEAAKRPAPATGAPQASAPSEAAQATVAPKPPRQQPGASPEPAPALPGEEPTPQRLARSPEPAEAPEQDRTAPLPTTAKPPEGVEAAETPPRRPPDAATAAPAEAKRPVRAAQAPRPKPRVQPPPATPARAQAEPPWSGIGDLPVRWLAAAAAAIVIAILFVIWLRRRSLPNDLDVTALVEAAEAEPDQHQDFDLGGASLERSEPDAGAKAFPRTTPQRPSVPREVGVPDIQAGPGRFDDVDSEKESEMDMESPELSRSETQTRVGAGAGGADVMRLVRELERRVAQLETRLDESTDARERLERQVAAQAEELRVQRAAIARTQRALRSMNRGEEEQATEPALREPIK